MEEITKKISLMLLGTRSRPVVEVTYYESDKDVVINNDKGERLAISQQNIGIFITMLQSIQKDFKETY